MTEGEELTEEQIKKAKKRNKRVMRELEEDISRLKAKKKMNRNEDGEIDEEIINKESKRSLLKKASEE